MSANGAGVATSYRNVRSAAAPAAKTLLLRGGVYAAMRRLRPSRQLAILRYHAICDLDGRYADPSICVTPGNFARHVAYLAHHYEVMPLPQAVAFLRQGKALPANAVAITFDDGYADNFAAARVLKQHAMTATFYLTAGCLAGGEPFWPAELRALVRAISTPSLRVQLSGKVVELPLDRDADRNSTIDRLTRMFKSHPIPVREELRRQLRALACAGDSASPMLTWDQVREMHAMGMTIGAHTITHPNLPSAGLAAATREIVGAKQRLEAEIGAPVTMFSYPNGGAEKYYTPELQRAVRQAGYAAATTSANGFAGSASDPYALERVQVAERLEDLVFALEVERFAFKPAARQPAGNR